MTSEGEGDDGDVLCCLNRSFGGAQDDKIDLLNGLTNEFNYEIDF